VVSADQAYVSLAQSGSFVSKDVGTGIGVTAADTLALTGAAAGNYTLTEPTGLTGTINPAPLVATANPLAAPLGNPLPTFTGTFIGFVDGEALTALEAAGYQAGWTSSVSIASPAGHYAITGAFNDGNYSVVQAAGNATAFDATLAESTVGQSSGNVLNSLASLPSASGAAANSTGFGPGAGDASDGSQSAGSSSASPDGTNASTGNGAGHSLGADSTNSTSDATATLVAAAGGAVSNSAGLVTGGAGASAGSQGTGSTSASPAGTNASTGNYSGLTLGANATTTASDGTVTLVAAGGSDTAVAESGGNAAMGSKNESPSDLGGRRLIVVRGGVNASLAR
jgi:hypothetical protein